MMSSRRFPVASEQDAIGGQGVSSGNASGPGAGNHARARFDPYRERALFPARWSRWCRENFASSTQLGAAFGVNEKTARLWMSGDSAPMGWAVDAAKDGRIDNVVPFPSAAPAVPARRRGMAA